MVGPAVPHSGESDGSGSVYEYFTARLGQPPLDTSLRELPVDSACGGDCVRVIDQAQVLLRLVDDAIAPLVYRIAEETVLIFWLG